MRYNIHLHLRVFCSPFIVTTTTWHELLLFKLLILSYFLSSLYLMSCWVCLLYSWYCNRGDIYGFIGAYMNKSINSLLDAWGNIYTWLLILLLLSQVFASVRWCPFTTWGDYLPPYLVYFSVTLMVPVSGYPVIIYRGAPGGHETNAHNVVDYVFRRQ